MDDPNLLYHRAKRADEQHNRAFRRYLEMLTNGASEEACRKQLAAADEAMEAAKQAVSVFEEATDERNR